MISLVLDTALAACTVGIVADDAVLAEMQELRARGHAERLIPMVQEVLARAQNPVISQVITTLGPGSFTGLRVALSAAQAFGLAWNCPVIGLSTLAAVAFSHGRAHGQKILAAHEAGRGQHYAQLFDAEAQAISDLRLATIDTIRHWAETENALLVGSSAPKPDYPAPLAMAKLVAAGCGTTDLSPIYGSNWGDAAP